MSRPHRHFFVNGKKEFSFFFDPKVTDEEEIMKKFTEDSLWKWYLGFYKKKLVSYKFSKDKLEVYIEIK